MTQNNYEDLSFNFRDLTWDLQFSLSFKTIIKKDFLFNNKTIVIKQKLFLKRSITD